MYRDKHTKLSDTPTEVLVLEGQEEIEENPALWGQWVPLENQGYQDLRAHPAPRGTAGDPSEALRVVQVREAKKVKQDLEVLRASQETQEPRGGMALPDPE
ncbi:hypothetical protein AMELA_G00163100 [Ameiurus melas]|uniref:Uncharacterized protein n=1 Tax=Ameiurus melas TaxID=219545 RepID=A0A7J6AF97_AMEME|nr:hypothetical protein AMELA_G00163100 [Ameiurus melas]